MSDKPEKPESIDLARLEEHAWRDVVLRFRSDLVAAEAAQADIHRSHEARLRMLHPGSARRFAWRDYRRRRAKTASTVGVLRKSPLFDAAWYLETYPDVGAARCDPVMHYATTGAIENRDPGPGFSTQSYLRTQLDVLRSGMNPLEHFELFGRAEGRAIERSSRARVTKSPDAQAAATDATILHSGQHYRVRFRRSSDTPLVVIVFEHWSPAPSLDGPFSSERFFADRGINAIGIKAASNDWFQNDEIHDAIAAVLAATEGMRRVSYGGSMGGFAAINFAHDLRLDSFVAVCPLFSLDRRKAPYETRWATPAAIIDFRNDKIDQIAQVPHGYIIYDPRGLDGLQARDILAHHDMTAIALRFGGHAQMLFLQQMGLYGTLLLDLIHGRFDGAQLRREVRRRRRGSSACWMNVSEILLERRNLAGALRAALTARILARFGQFEPDLSYARVLLAMGQRQRAMNLVAPYASNDMAGEAARWYLETWQAMGPS